MSRALLLFHLTSSNTESFTVAWAALVGPTKSMKPLTVAVLAVLVIALLVLHDVDAARRRSGGGRSRGGSRGSRGSRASRSSRRRSSVRRIRSSSTPKITKTTPIKPITFRTPVITSQAKRGSRTKLFTKATAGYLVTKYALSKAPVYYEEFPLRERYVSIPEKRAVRLSSERVSLLDSNGHLCVENSSKPQTLKDGIENLFELNTTVIYKTNPENVITLYGVDNTVSLEDVKDKNFTVTTRARYNVTVVELSAAFFLAEIFKKVSFDPYNFQFRITRLSTRKSEQMKNFRA